MEIVIYINFKNDSLEMVVNQNDSLEIVKRKVSELVDVPVSELSIYFKDRYLVDDRKTVEELKINENDTIFLKKKASNTEIEGSTQNMSVTNLIKDNPMVKNMLKNPDMMQSMLKSLPGYDKQMKKNPEMKKLLNNPNTREEFEKLADNPDYYEQQLKNIDIAMSKLENIPGGFNMMTSLTKEIRDPFSAMMNLNSMDLNTSSLYQKNNEKNQENNQQIRNVWQTNKVENPLVKYRAQLKELSSMGFNDMSKNAKAIEVANGDVDVALQILYEKEGQW